MHNDDAFDMFGDDGDDDEIAQAIAAAADEARQAHFSNWMEMGHLCFGCDEKPGSHELEEGLLCDDCAFALASAVDAGIFGN